MIALYAPKENIPSDVQDPVGNGNQKIFITVVIQVERKNVVPFEQRRARYSVHNRCLQRTGGSNQARSHDGTIREQPALQFFRRLPQNFTKSLSMCLGQAANPS